MLYDLPFGKSHKYLNHGVAGGILGNWGLSSIVTVSTGFPLNIAAGADRSNTGHGYDRPNGVSGASLSLDSSPRSTAEWFNIQAVACNPWAPMETSAATR